ncbi:hypothetical protein [Tenacibaculum agarivorans]|uniref:hypothetical protein n=1 Tax=Tenacibaculum agarivorans TaxID=1908389 RepID=UPI00094BB7C5|nr:hypothetical protein [Tenacibaculum agarivorans]
MRKITLFIFLVFVSFQMFSQNREGSLFYSFVERTETEYKANVDLYEVGKIQFIKIELVDEDKNELASEVAELVSRDGKYFLSFKDEETPVEPQNINLTLKNEYNEINYPQINIKLMDKLLRVLDYSQKVFY